MTESRLGLLGLPSQLLLGAVGDRRVQDWDQ